MKKNKIIFWVCTTFIFLFEGVMPALTSHTEVAVQSIRHLGFPDYFRIELTIFKVIGALILMIPPIPGRVKEWVYAGFGINFISACVAHVVMDGLVFDSFFPLFIFAILIVSYVNYHKIKAAEVLTPANAYS